MEEAFPVSEPEATMVAAGRKMTVRLMLAAVTIAGSDRFHACVTAVQWAQKLN